MTMTISEMKRLHGECNQQNCNNQGTHWMYWPGQGKRLICDTHMPVAKRIAESMGFSLHFERRENNDD